jgi:hypothetical protein
MNDIGNTNDYYNTDSNSWDIMFQHLIDYKEEHGTLRFPSEEQCAATKNEEFIALQRWVKGQVSTYRYSKKKERAESESVRRLRDIGFDFDNWFVKPGKKKGSTTTKGSTKKERVEKVKPFNRKESVEENEDAGEATDDNNDNKEMMLAQEEAKRVGQGAAKMNNFDGVGACMSIASTR